jgi:hypothetical protein
MPLPAALLNDDIEAIVEAIANRVVSKLIGTAEQPNNNGLKPYDALKYYDAIREARKGNNRPSREYLSHYHPRSE